MQEVQRQAGDFKGVQKDPHAVPGMQAGVSDIHEVADQLDPETEEALKRYTAIIYD